MCCIRCAPVSQIEPVNDSGQSHAGWSEPSSTQLPPFTHGFPDAQGISVKMCGKTILILVQSQKSIHMVHRAFITASGGILILCFFLLDVTFVALTHVTKLAGVVCLTDAFESGVILCASAVIGTGIWRTD